MNQTRLTCVGAIIATAATLFGCVSDGNQVIQPRHAEPTPVETAEYQQEKQEMISERD